jgi:hypothetical protein
MFEEILSKIGKVFQRHGLPYMIIGGQAVLLYGEPRLTRDIDITLGVNIDRLDELLAVAQELALKPIPRDIQNFVKETMVLPAIEETTGIRVDFIFSFSPYETQAFKRVNKISILNQEICFASPEDLIIHKIFSGRPRDLEDVRTVLLKNPHIDFLYIDDWLKEFDTTSEESRFLKTFEELKEELKA